MRLVKYVAHAGAASRRAAEELIAAGRVTVGGEVMTDPARDVDETSGVELDGQILTAEAREVWLVNKPVGVVSTAKEPGKRKAVVELVSTEARVYPVGRLDADSSGLLLLTNDGELANLLTHPRYEVSKTYRARLRRVPTEGDLERLRSGIELEDGMTHPAEAKRTGDFDIELTIHEGRNRQVRRMVEALGNRVEALERVRFGPLQLGKLAQGEARRLDEAEVERLWEDAKE